MSAVGIVEPGTDQAPAASANTTSLPGSTSADVQELLTSAVAADSKTGRNASDDVARDKLSYCSANVHNGGSALQTQVAYDAHRHSAASSGAAKVNLPSDATAANKEWPASGNGGHCGRTSLSVEPAASESSAGDKREAPTDAAGTPHASSLRTLSLTSPTPSTCASEANSEISGRRRSSRTGTRKLSASGSALSNGSDWEDKVRANLELIAKEKQKKFEEMLEAQKQADEHRHRQEEQRRQRIEDAKRKEEERQRLVEERRLAREREQEEQWKAAQQKKQSKLPRSPEDSTYKHGRYEAYGFGSCTRRFDDILTMDPGRRSASISNLATRQEAGGDTGDGLHAVSESEANSGCCSPSLVHASARMLRLASPAHLAKPLSLSATNLSCSGGSRLITRRITLSPTAEVVCEAQCEAGNASIGAAGPGFLSNCGGRRERKPYLPSCASAMTHSSALRLMPRHDVPLRHVALPQPPLNTQAHSMVHPDSAQRSSSSEHAMAATGLRSSRSTERRSLTVSCQGQASSNRRAKSTDSGTRLTSQARYHLAGTGLPSQPDGRSPVSGTKAAQSAHKAVHSATAVAGPLNSKKTSLHPMGASVAASHSKNHASLVDSAVAADRGLTAAAGHGSDTAPSTINAAAPESDIQIPSFKGDADASAAPASHQNGRTACDSGRTVGKSSKTPAPPKATAVASSVKAEAAAAKHPGAQSGPGKLLPSRAAEEQHGVKRQAPPEDAVKQVHGRLLAGAAVRHLGMRKAASVASLPQKAAHSAVPSTKGGKLTGSETSHDAKQLVALSGLKTKDKHPGKAANGLSILSEQSDDPALLPAGIKAAVPTSDQTLLQKDSDCHGTGLAAHNVASITVGCESHHGDDCSAQERERRSSQMPVTADGSYTLEDSYKSKLAEKRRQARDKAEKEAEAERNKQVEMRQEAEEKLRRELEEQRRFEEEESRLVEEARQAERDRLQKSIQEAEARRSAELAASEAERQAKEEADRKAKEEADKKERALREKIEREEVERQERKKKLESIMKRVKTESPVHEAKVKKSEKAQEAAATLNQATEHSREPTSSALTHEIASTAQVSEVASTAQTLKTASADKAREAASTEQAPEAASTEKVHKAVSGEHALETASTDKVREAASIEQALGTASTDQGQEATSTGQAQEAASTEQVQQTASSGQLEMTLTVQVLETAATEHACETALPEEISKARSSVRQCWTVEAEGTDETPSTAQACEKVPIGKAHEMASIEQRCEAALTEQAQQTPSTARSHSGTAMNQGARDTASAVRALEGATNGRGYGATATEPREATGTDQVHDATATEQLRKKAADSTASTDDTLNMEGAAQIHVAASAEQQRDTSSAWHSRAVGLLGQAHDTASADQANGTALATLAAWETSTEHAPGAEPREHMREASSVEIALGSVTVNAPVELVVSTHLPQQTETTGLTNGSGSKASILSAPTSACHRSAGSGKTGSLHSVVTDDSTSCSSPDNFTDVLASVMGTVCSTGDESHACTERGALAVAGVAAIAVTPFAVDCASPFDERNCHPQSSSTASSSFPLQSSSNKEATSHTLVSPEKQDGHTHGAGHLADNAHARATTGTTNATAVEAC